MAIYFSQLGLRLIILIAVITIWFIRNLSNDHTDIAEVSKWNEISNALYTLIELFLDLWLIFYITKMGRQGKEAANETFEEEDRTT